MQDGMFIINETLVRTAATLSEANNSFSQALAFGQQYKDANVPFYYIADYSTYKIYVVSKHRMEGNYH